MARGQIETDITMPSRFGRILAVVTALIAGYGLVFTVVEAGWEGLLVSSWPFVFIVYFAYAIFWAPSVTVSDGGVTLRNVLRTIHLPWPAIQRIDTKFALTLYTSYGHFAAWAAPAPTRYSVGQTDKSDLARLPESTYFAGTVRPGDNPASDSGQAALVVRQRWEALRDAGHLDSARLEKERPDIHWHLVTIVALVVLGAAAVLSALH